MMGSAAKYLEHLQVRVVPGKIVPMGDRSDILAKAKGGGGGSVIRPPADDPGPWRNSGTLGKAIQRSFAAREKAETKLPKSIEDAANFYIDRTFAGKRTDPQSRMAATVIAKATGFDRVAEDVRETIGRPGFETLCGFTIIGAGVKQFDVSNNPWKEFVYWESNEQERHYRAGPVP
jgi:hypothetical protein